MNTLRYPRSKTCCQWYTKLTNQKGLSLIYLIVIIVLFALLISASVVMFGTSTFTSATANASQRAMYLAESGLRFIREEFSKPPASPGTGPSEVNQLLSDVYNKTYKLGGGSEGQFQITTIEPTWFSATASTGATSFSMTAPGNSIPAAFTSMDTDSIKKLIIAPKFYTYTGVGTLTGQTFSAVSLTEGLSSPASHTPVFRVSETAASAAANSTSLTVKGSYFPEKRGQIGICESINSNICTNMRAFYYENSSVVGTNRTLTGIIPAQTGYSFPAIAADTNVILLGSLKISSKGTFGQNQPVERTAENYYRAVNLYYTSGLPPEPVLDPKISDFDTTTQGLQDLINPATSSIDQIKDIEKTDFDNALNIGAYNHTTGFMWWRWYDPNDGIPSLPLDQYRLANDGKLTYSVQIKLKTTSNKDKPYFIAGLSFRLDDADSSASPAVLDNMYAISFLKINSDWNTVASNKGYYGWLQQTNNSSWSDVKQYNPGRWYLVLWKRVNNDWTLLGYKELAQTDWVYEYTVNPNGSYVFKDWSTLRIDIEEKIATASDGSGYSVGEHYNIIKAKVQAAYVTNGYPPTPPGPYKRRATDAGVNTSTTQTDAPIIWDEGTYGTSFWHDITWTKPGGSTASEIKDDSLSTLNYAAIPTWTSALLSSSDYLDPNNYWHYAPKEFGFHIFSDDPAQNTIFLDNFALKIEGGGAGNSGGNLYLQ